MENSIKAVLGGIAYVRNYHQALLRTLAVPFALFAVIYALYFVPGTSTTWFFVLGLAKFIPYTLIAITTHRIVLKGVESVPMWGINRFRWRELKFVGYELLVGVVILPLHLLQSIPYIGETLILVASTYVASRFALVFPAIAIDSQTSLFQSWEATKAHQLMMFVAVAIFPITLRYVAFGISEIPGFGLIADLILVIATVFIFAALSVAYKIVQET